MTTKTSRKPTHAVYQVRGEGEKAYWTKLGAAWLHEDKEGLNVSLDYMPERRRPARDPRQQAGRWPDRDPRGGPLMVTSATDRAALLQLFPEFGTRGLSRVSLDRALDAWFADDHYSDNPAYETNPNDCSDND